MKKSLLIAGLLVSGVAFGQGQVNVINSSATAVYDVDGVTKLAAANGLFSVIYNGTYLNSNGAAGNAFAAAGIFNNGLTSIPGVTSGTVTLTINVWNKNTGASASEVIVTPGLATGTAPVDKITNGSTPWKSVTLSVVPEPSTYALAALGLGGLFFVSRRK